MGWVSDSPTHSHRLKCIHRKHTQPVYLCRTSRTQHHVEKCSYNMFGVHTSEMSVYSFSCIRLDSIFCGRSQEGTQHTRHTTLTHIHTHTLSHNPYSTITQARTQYTKNELKKHTSRTKIARVGPRSRSRIIADGQPDASGAFYTVTPRKNSTSSCRVQKLETQKSEASTFVM